MIPSSGQIFTPMMFGSTASALAAAMLILVLAVFKTRRDVRKIGADLEDLKRQGILNQEKHVKKNLSTAGRVSQGISNKHPEASL